MDEREAADQLRKMAEDRKAKLREGLSRVKRLEPEGNPSDLEKFITSEYARHGATRPDLSDD